MEAVTCPYCQSKIRINDVEMNDGACPECGAPVTGSLLFSDEGTTPQQTDEYEETEEERSPGEEEQDISDL